MAFAEGSRYRGTLEKPYLPQEIDEVTQAFPSNVRHLYPNGPDIPEEFESVHNPWRKLVAQWFFKGLPEETDFYPKEDIDAATAIRHISAVMRTYETPHEFKEEAAAFLLSEWFEDVKSEGESLVHPKKSVLAKTISKVVGS